MNVPEPVQKLYEALSGIPPEFDKARELLAAYQPTEEELMRVAIELVENVMAEHDAMNKKWPSATSDKTHRGWLYDTFQFLLEHGMNPNTILEKGTTEEDNVMMSFKYLYGADMAANVMRLLLEHGADPNLEMDGGSPFDWIDLGLSFDPIYKKWLCTHLVQCIMVMQAYGGEFDDSVPFVMREGYTSEIFKEFEKFDYRFGKEKGWPGNIHVFEQATGKTVADYV